MKKVAVGLSGGVDSSVAALLLKEKGYEVIGITLKLSSVDSCSSDIQVCCSTKDILDAKRVASYLGIQHFVVDWQELFKEKVIDYFVEEYKKGNTPNPCSICNREIKTGRLAQYAKLVLNADFLATGHYINLENTEYGKVIKRGKDSKKDQSYFLALIHKEILNLLEFPLGSFTKEEVRNIAEKYKIPVSQKKESFEICFTAGKTPAEYLSENNLYDFREGDIIHISGKKLGKHKGLPNYTIGQRRGIGISWHKPLYVLEKNEEKNTIVVGEDKDILTDTVRARDFNFFIPLEKWKNVSVQGRYKQKPDKVKKFRFENGILEVKLEKPNVKYASGQVLAVYENDRLLGGGIIV
jgi:tRNA-specific 2-thiouridylase